MNSSRRILQIIPRKPGGIDGIGDYAARLAQQLQADYGIETKFIAPPLELGNGDDTANCAGIILHYVNYGYHPRGIPKQLPATLRQLKQTIDGKFLTVFHELYASAPPWRTAFWLQPWQKSIARSIARISDACVVSSELMRDMLQRLAPGCSISVHPVVSTLGEPDFSPPQFAKRDPHRWVIFGGTHLLQRSLHSFRQQIAVIPDFFSPRELFLLGGSDTNALRNELDQIRGVTCHYHPAIDASAASEILSSCSFAWIDYFRQRDVPTAAILKSGSFASYCAHGVIPILPHHGSPVALRGDQLPGPYFVEANRTHLPAFAERAKVSADIYEWYRRHASVALLAQAIAALLHVKQ